MKTTLRSRIGFALAFAAMIGGLALLPAKAQTPSNPAPYNVDIGALITNSLRTPGTVTTDAQANTNWKGVTCTFDETDQSGSPSKSFAVQGYDAATASWQLLGAITIGPAKVGVPYTLTIYPGIATTSLPSNTVGVSLHLPRTWRLAQTVFGTNTATTSKIGCVYLL